MGAEEELACALTLGWLLAKEAPHWPQGPSQAGSEDCQTPRPKAKAESLVPQPWLSPAGPRYDTRTIVWICLTLITGLVVLLLLLICKKRWVVWPSHTQPLLSSAVPPACPQPHRAGGPRVPGAGSLTNTSSHLT